VWRGAGNGISDDGARALAAALEENTSLHALDISGKHRHPAP